MDEKQHVTCRKLMLDVIYLIRLRGGFHYSNKAFAIQVTKLYQFGAASFYSKTTFHFVALIQPAHHVCSHGSMLRDDKKTLCLSAFD